jgi:hypothetical protein
VYPPRNPAAGRTFTAGIFVAAARLRLAVEQLRQGDCRHALSDPRWSGKDQAGRKSPAKRRPGDQRLELLVSGDLAKRHSKERLKGEG